MKSIKISALFLIIFSTVTIAYSQSEISESGKAGMSFLNISPSAYIASMGGGATALDSGASSIWSNPSLIAFREQKSLQINHTSWIEGINQEYAAFSSKAGSGAIGLGLELFDSGNIEGRDDFGNETGDYSIKNAAVSVTYARQILEWVALGATYKKLFQKVYTETAGGYAVDAGLTVRTPLKGLTVGASGRNYGSMAKLRNEKTELPSSFTIGGHYSGLIPTWNKNFNFVADAVFPKYGDNGIHLGLEVAPYSGLYLRTGYRNDSDFENVIFGFGFMFEKVSADFSYSPLSGISDNALRISINLTGF